MTTPHVFRGQFIAPAAYAGAKPIDVFHRQLEPKKIDSVLPKDLHILYRVRFPARVGERVRLFVTADDYYKLWVNGVFAGQGPAPGFPFRYYYNEIDLTPYLRDGENVLAFHCLYQGLINRVWVSGDDRLGLLFDVVRDGEVIRSSDDGVLCRLHSGFTPLGKVGYDTQFMERYDSRSREAGFELPDYDDTAWERAVPCLYDDRTLVPQPAEMLEFEEISPAAISREGNRITCDFEAHYVGTVRLRARGRSGDRVILRFGQELDGEGRTRFILRSNCKYEEDWILSGGEDALDEYDYKSFRYLEMELPEGCEAGTPTLLARHYPFRLRRVCGSTDPELLRIWNLSVRSLRYGVQEVIQDCMDREKGQYLGDGSFTSASFAVLTGDLSVMEKLIDNALDTAFIERSLMTCSPCSMMQEIAEYVLMLPDLLLAHTVLSGSTAFASARYDRMADVLERYREAYEREDGLLHDLDKWCVVDWPEKARDGYAFDLREGRVALGTHSVINAYYVGAIRAMNRLAGKTGRKPYRDGDAPLAAYLSAFYDPARHVFCDLPASGGPEDGERHSALPSEAFALCFGLCPDREAEKIAVERILAAPAEKMAFFGTFAALCGLKRLGREDLVRRMLRDEGRWLRMLREGADSTFEAWGRDLKWNTSLFHLCYTYPVLFLCDWGMEKIWRE